MDRQLFRTALKALMQRELLTVGGIAAVLHVSRQAVYQWLWPKAASKRVRSDVVYKVCRTFHLKVDEFKALGEGKEEQ